MIPEGLTELMLELEGLIKDALRKPEAQELVLGE